MCKVWKEVEIKKKILNKISMYDEEHFFRQFWAYPSIEQKAITICKNDQYYE